MGRLPSSNLSGTVLYPYLIYSSAKMIPSNPPESRNSVGGFSAMLNDSSAGLTFPVLTTAAEQPKKKRKYVRKVYKEEEQASDSQHTDGKDKRISPVWIRRAFYESDKVNEIVEITNGSGSSVGVKCIPCLLKLPYRKYKITRHLQSRKHKERVQEWFACNPSRAPTNSFSLASNDISPDSIMSNENQFNERQKTKDVGNDQYTLNEKDDPSLKYKNFSHEEIKELLRIKKQKVECEQKRHADDHDLKVRRLKFEMELADQQNRDEQQRQRVQIVMKCIEEGFSQDKIETYLSYAGF